MSGDESDVSGGGARTWSPKRHFFFLISFPETNLGDIRDTVQCTVGEGRAWCGVLEFS